jgi:hypothetical protein
MPDEILDESKTTETTESTTSQPDPIEGLKNKNYALIGEQKTLKAKLAEQQALLNRVTEVLGTLDPDALAAIKQAQENERTAQERLEQELSRKEAETAKQYQDQIKALSERVTQSQQVLVQKAQDEALQQLFKNSAGNDFDSFKALLATKFKIEYVEDGVNDYGLPVYRIDSIKEKTGKAILIAGEVATPEDILSKARKGEYGTPLASVFVAYNQSTGMGLPVGTTNRQGVITYPRSQQATLMQQPGMADRILKGEVAFED